MKKNSLHTILGHLPGRLRAPLERTKPFYEKDAHEIILRADRPVAVECTDRRYYLTEDGVLTGRHGTDGVITVSKQDIATVFKSICEYSIYARQSEVNQGYITIGSGVRVGVCGKAVIDGSSVINIKDITTLSFRVASEIKGCSETLLSMLDPLKGVLICGPPCSGKTTLIRDAARLLSERYKVSLLDERGEIAAVENGTAGFDVGMSDVLVNMKKGDAVGFVLRSLSPDIIICDELGGEEDARSLSEALRCGAAFIATIHAGSMDDLKKRPISVSLLHTGAFRYVVFLSGRRHAGVIEKIYELRDIRA